MTQWVTEPAGPPVPIVACVPHGGSEIPAELTVELAVAQEFLWCDWLTRELYEFLPDLGITTVITPFSRFVADVNRDPAGEQHGGFWTSVVAARMPNGRAVYRRPLTAAEIRSRILLAHEPFHRALDAVVESLLGRFPRLLLLDERFTGGWTVRRFADRGCVDAIQVELSQRRYLDLDRRVFPAPPRPLGFGVTQRLLSQAFADITAGLDRWIAGP